MNIYEINHRLFHTLAALLRARRSAPPESCGCSYGGPLKHVSNMHVSGDDDDLPPSMEGKGWVFTGIQCAYCGARHRGSYRTEEAQSVGCVF